jgi:hypothetical protein
MNRNTNCIKCGKTIIRNQVQKDRRGRYCYDCYSNSHVRCPKCGSPYSSDNGTCYECGHEQSKLNLCRSCRMRLVPLDRFYHRSDVRKGYCYDCLKSEVI